jgi:tetratricopeptide (TPR) repeat protein
VSKELGVRYVLEGSVRKVGDQVRITAQLIDATTDQHLWAERYDRPLTDIFALQDALVQKIVTTLQLQLTVRERGYLVRKTENVEAYDVFLRGAAYFTRGTREANAQARQLYEQAVALDPTYADAYAHLAGTYRVEWSNRWGQDPQVLERAFELAQQARALDDTLPTAYVVLSWIYWEKLQYEQALAEAERVIALEPSNAHGYAMQGEMLRSMGRPEEALRSIEKAMHLNPRPPGRYLATLTQAYIMTGRYAEALATLKTRLLRGPGQSAYRDLANAYRQQWAAQLSQDPQTLALALAAAQSAIGLRDASPANHRALGYVYLWQQQYEPALAEMERAIALDSNEARGTAAPMEVLNEARGTAAFNYAGLAEVLSRMGRSVEALEAAIVEAHLASVGMAYAVAGRPEQALASLQRFLSRYPNVLQAHLTLAAVYSELGRKAEARAAAAEVLRLNPHFSLEVHRQREPLKDPAQLERHLATLRRAGLR